MSHMEHEGKVYCDWRIAVEDCEGSEYFKLMYALGEALGAICFPSLIISLAIRKYAFGGSLSILPTGENGFLLLIFPVPIAFTFQFVSVLAQWPDLASGVLWAFSYPFVNISMAYYLSFIRKTFGNLVNIPNKSKLKINDRVFSSLLVAFALFAFVTHVIVISVAHSYISKGQFALGRYIEKVGLIITSANCLIITAASGSGSFTLAMKVYHVLKDSKDVGSRSPLSKGVLDNKFLTLMFSKLQQHFVVTITLGALQIGYFLLLAFYPSFFTNLAFSKAVAFIIIIVHPTSGMFHCSMTTVFDIKKWLHDNQLKEKPPKEKSKKEEGSIQLTVPDQDQIPRVAEESRSKEGPAE